MPPSSDVRWRSAFVAIAVGAAVAKGAQLIWCGGDADLPVQAVVRQIIVAAVVIAFLVKVRRRDGDDTSLLVELGLVLPWKVSARGDGRHRWLIVFAVGLLLATLSTVSGVDAIDGFGRWSLLALGAGSASWAWWRLHRSWSGVDRAGLVVLVGVVAVTVVAVVGLELDDQPRAFGLLSWTNLLLVTAFGEELIFRGALLAVAHRLFAWRSAERLTVAAFVLWHVGDELSGASTKPVGDVVVSLLATVALTTAGGVIFSWLRRTGGSLAFSVGGHVASNLPGGALKKATEAAVQALR